jgi:hypothetical protein
MSETDDTPRAAGGASGDDADEKAGKRAVDQAVAADAEAAKKGRYGIIGAIVAVLFALFYAYDVWAAVSPFFALPAFYSSIGLDPNAVPWWVLIIGVAVPPVVFALALAAGWRRNALEKALIFFVGFAVVSGLSLSVIALEAFVRPALHAIAG